MNNVVRFVRVSPAMVVAMAALFVALTGTAVATTSALITGNQIKNSSITGADIKNKSLRPIDFRGSVRGARGAAGPAGAQGQQGPQGSKGDQGDRGPSFGDAVTPSGPTTTGCASVVVASIDVQVPSPSRIYVAAHSSVFVNTTLTGGSITPVLRNAGDTTTVATASESVASTPGGGIVTVASMGLLTSGSAVFVAPAGSYILKMMGSGADGSCSGMVSFSRNHLSYMLIGATSS